MGWFPRLGDGFSTFTRPNDTWTETVLYSFCQISDGGFCSDGMEPTAGLVADSAGNLYGTTAHGGGENCPAGDGGCGTIFELSPPMGPGEPWVYTLLYQFCQIPGDEQCSDGIFPYGKLTFDTTGNLYGTTQMGGTYAQGNVFKLSPGQNGWTETTLYSFCTLGKDPRCPDGRHPVSTLTLDRDGNIYGTTSEGGSAKYEGGGVVFKLSLGQNGWKETVLDAFPSGAGKRGGYLLGSVNFDSVGNLYSTAAQGGKFESGTVFRLSPNNGGTQTTFSFNRDDGFYPTAGVLIDPRNGTLYGTTSAGGTNNNCGGGCGTVYKIDGKGETVIYSFFGSPDGDGTAPMAGLEADKHGHLYGTTSYGGPNNMGTVFEIIP